MSCVSINPHGKPSHGLKSLLQLLKHDNKLLRFEARLDTTDEMNKGRKFIVSYRLADDMISIYEPFTSAADGGFGGTYLSFQLLQRSDSNPNKPEYVQPEDLYIGATLNVYGTTFVLTDADKAVAAFMDEHPELFTDEGLKATRTHFGN